MSRASDQPQLFSRPEMSLGFAVTLLLAGCSVHSQSLAPKSRLGPTEAGPEAPKGTAVLSPGGADVASGMPMAPDSPRLEPTASDPTATMSDVAVVTAGQPIQLQWERGLLHLVATQGSLRVTVQNTERGVSALMLDDERWRKVSPNGIRLRELLPEDEEPSPGRHRLLGCQVEGETYRCEELSFVLDAKLARSEARSDEKPNDEPRCVLLEPGGTFWSGALVPLLVLWTGQGDNEASPQGVSLQLRGQGDGVGHFSVIPGRRDKLQLKSGDYEVRMSCGSAVTTRTITVNSGEPAP